jgi:hypothetical protein
MPISASTNDQTSTSSSFDAAFGGLNINKGIKSEWVVGGLVIIAALWFFSKGRK